MAVGLLPPGIGAGLADVQRSPPTACQQQEQAHAENHHARVVRVRTADAASARRTAANPSTITAKGLRGSSMTAKPSGIRTPTCNRAKQRTTGPQGRSGLETPWPERCSGLWFRSWMASSFGCFEISRSLRPFLDNRFTPQEWPAPPGPRRPRVGLGRRRPACPHIQRSRRFLDGCRKPGTGDHKRQRRQQPARRLMDRGSAGRAWAAVVGSFMEGSSARAGVAGALPGQGGGRAVDQCSKAVFEGVVVERAAALADGHRQGGRGAAVEQVRGPPSPLSTPAWTTAGRCSPDLRAEPRQPLRLLL